MLCHSYDELRSDFLNSVNAILLPHGFSSLSNEVLLKFILYGDEPLTVDTNEKLLEATFKFIHASERFQMLHCCKLPYISTYFLSVTLYS